jgi:hypothetical protein
MESEIKGRREGGREVSTLTRTPVTLCICHSPAHAHRQRETDGQSKAKTQEHRHRHTQRQTQTHTTVTGAQRQTQENRHRHRHIHRSIATNTDANNMPQTHRQGTKTKGTSEARTEHCSWRACANCEGAYPCAYTVHSTCSRRVVFNGK